MDLDVYYREQDERMNMPDESFDEYLVRIGVQSVLHDQNLKQHHDFHAQNNCSESSRLVEQLEKPGENGKNQHEDAELSIAESSKFTFTEVRDHDQSQKSLREVQKRKAPVDENTPHKRRVSTFDSSLVTPTRTKSLPPSNPRRKDTPIPNDPEIASRQDESMISPSKPLTPSTPNLATPSPLSATKSMLAWPPPPLAHVRVPSIESEPRSGPSSPAYVLTPSTPARNRKRKTLQDAEPSSAQKKRGAPPVALISSSSIEEIEEITSFSASPGTKKKTPQRRTPAKAKPKSKGATLRKIPPLNLQTIMPPAQPEPPTSPIDEISIVENKDALKAAPNKLYLEIKQRIASHTSAKQEGKLLKLPLPATAKPGYETDDDDSSVVDLSSAPSSSSSFSPLNAARSALISSKRLPKKTQPSSSKIVKGKEKEKEKPKPAKSKKKEKPPPVSPEEYAQKLVDKAKAKMAGIDPDAPTPTSKFLHGMNIFYTGGDMTYASERTRGRMDLIVKHGATLLPRYDPVITTHIVTDASPAATTRALGIKELSEIPNHIPTITWNWILNGISSLSTLGKGERVRMREFFCDAAFSSRIGAGKQVHPASRNTRRAVGKGKAKADPQSTDNLEFSHISDFTQDRPRRATTSSPHNMHNMHDTEDESQDDERNSVHGAPLSPPTSPQRLDEKRSRAASSSSVPPVAGPSRISKNVDPLAEFIAKARAEAETEWARQGEVVESEGPPSDSDTDPTQPIVTFGPPKKRGWTCDTKEAQRKTCVNQDIINKLEELKALHAAKLGDEDKWRVFSYSKCIRALRNHPKRISSFAEARAIRGVGEKTAAKVSTLRPIFALDPLMYNG
ncbi:hypothetical protein C0991_008573 [Blastosporella zonata]|nr:hypothetical protein C0991_008573 [Blastosporella zonata]